MKLPKLFILIIPIYISISIGCDTTITENTNTVSTTDSQTKGLFNNQTTSKQNQIEEEEIFHQSDNEIPTKKYKLSERTKKEFKKFKELEADMVEMQKLGNIILAIVPFRHLLDGPDLTDPIEITTENWIELGTASKGLSTNYRNQLKFFCQSEAIKQNRSVDDYKFWVNLAKQFVNK